jgi:hypothetical protein
MIKLVENFREFMDLASINQGPDGWTIYGSNPRKNLGETEKVSFPDLGIGGVTAKIDTGADGTAIHAKDITIKDGILHCWIISSKNKLKFKDFKKIKVTSSSGESEDRYQISTPIKFGHSIFKIKVSLTDRDELAYPCILGRNFIRAGKFTVDINQ